MLPAECLHPLKTVTAPPAQFTFPFCYTPHSLCVEASMEVQDYLRNNMPELEEQEGKMFGVLVVSKTSNSKGQLFFLAAYSGLLLGRNDWDWFVPSVYDAQPPNGYFKTKEREISSLNHHINTLQSSDEHHRLEVELERVQQAAKHSILSYKAQMAEAKARRDLRRQSSLPLTETESADMVRESQFQKAELRRIRKQQQQIVATAEEQLQIYNESINRLRHQRRQMSESLQQWLFRQYNMLNAKGQRRNLISIFSNTPQITPPAGAGDCCAPKLLQYAYENGFQPVCMAEFWWGKSPKNAIRHQGEYYPACRSKCKPILEHMLQGLDVESNPLENSTVDGLKIITENEEYLTIYKPAGLLSVPGLDNSPSVQSLMRQYCQTAEGPMIVHRLDMATSGVMVVAKTWKAYYHFQAQFARHEIQKTYVARLDGIVKRPRLGLISIPLRPDPLNRPCQMVDYKEGKESVTQYEIVGFDGQQTLVRLFPKTGRTHQLRVHCAHPDGLGVPIVGDTLYGHPGERLMLHAQSITFSDPRDGRKTTIHYEAPFQMTTKKS